VFLLGHTLCFSLGVRLLTTLTCRDLLCVFSCKVRLTSWSAFWSPFLSCVLSSVDEFTVNLVDGIFLLLLGFSAVLCLCKEGGELQSLHESWLHWMFLSQWYQPWPLCVIFDGHSLPFLTGTSKPHSISSFSVAPITLTMLSSLFIVYGLSVLLGYKIFSGRYLCLLFTEIF
jgi:hypothetical protein